MKKELKIYSPHNAKIKKLYLDDHKNCAEIGEILNLSKYYINNYLNKSDFRRSRSESISLRQKGKKRTNKVRKILSKAQQDMKG